jgi:hypothetical protein
MIKCVSEFMINKALDRVSAISTQVIKVITLETFIFSEMFIKINLSERIMYRTIGFLFEICIYVLISCCQISSL